MLRQLVYIHITASLLDPHDIHHEGKNLCWHNLYTQVQQYTYICLHFSGSLSKSCLLCEFHWNRSINEELSQSKQTATCVNLFVYKKFFHFLLHFSGSWPKSYLPCKFGLNRSINAEVSKSKQTAKCKPVCLHMH